MSPDFPEIVFLHCAPHNPEMRPISSSSAKQLKGGWICPPPMVLLARPAAIVVTDCLIPFDADSDITDITDCTVHPGGQMMITARMVY